MARSDGMLEIWDLLEASHQPVAEISVSSAPLTAISVNLSAPLRSSGKHLIAAGKPQYLPWSCVTSAHYLDSKILVGALQCRKVIMSEQQFSEKAQLYNL